MTNSALKAVLVIAVTFGVGAAAGAAADHLYHQRSRAGMRVRGPFREFRELGLSKTQCAAIDSVFERGRPRIAVAFQAVEPRMRATMDSIRAEVRTLLTPEQRVKFDSAAVRDSGFGRGFRAPGSGALREGPGGRARPPGPCG
jgi:Spy/CpxP family protein refolding chaperone